ncbi:MAG TPA: hypothetical protein DE315_00330 [Candidatus Omnitrophica bacterium]|nr:hypothetical protein [Candidatus Omnitrophota bacterium]HCI43970.1 hypothetical protein [Candidatus Omnitrophota bacterium]
MSQSFAIERSAMSKFSLSLVFVGAVLGLSFIMVSVSYGQEDAVAPEIVRQAEVVVVQEPAPEQAAPREAVEEPQAGSLESIGGPLEELPVEGTAEVEPLPEGMEGNLTLDLRNIDVTDAMKFLAVKAGLNIITTKNVAGRVSLMVENVRIKDIFDIMLRSNDLAFIKQGNIYNVMAEEEYKALFGRRFSDLRQVKVVRLQYAIPEQTFAMLDILKSEVGRVLVEPDSGTILLMDIPENIQRIEEALATLEQKNSVRVFNLQYAKAKDLEEQLKTQLDAKKVGSIKADERSNQVIVQALPSRMEDIERLITALDKKTKEVLIDTQIVKIKLSDDLETGVDWEGVMGVAKTGANAYIGSTPFSVIQAATETWQSRKDFLTAQGGEIGAYPFSGNTASVSSSTKVTPGERLHFGVIDGDKDIDVMVKFLQTLGRTQILSNPKIAVTNNQEAKIHVGERQAYVTTTTTSGQSTTTVSEEVTFVDVGIQLLVTPTINDEGFVTMKVKPEISSVVSSLTTPSGNTIPIIDTSTAETTVMVKDGSTIIIGGMVREEKTSSSSGVPFLSKIPLIGLIFSSTANAKERTELLVMLTPHIVSGDILTTGDEGDLRLRYGKDYEEYHPFTEDKDVEPRDAPEERIKSYRDL